MRIILFITLLISTQLLSAQKWEKGYYYDLEGNKHTGMVKLHRKSIPSFISFKNTQTKKKTLSPSSFIAFCTEKDSFVVIRDLINFNKIILPFQFNVSIVDNSLNYYKVIPGNTISGYIMYASSQYIFGEVDFYSMNEMNGGGFSMIYFLKKLESDYVVIYNEQSMNGLLNFVKDDPSVLDYLKRIGFKQYALKNAINQYNKRQLNSD